MKKMQEQGVSESGEVKLEKEEMGADSRAYPPVAWWNASPKTHKRQSFEVLIGHIKNKMNKQTFSERCTLCQDVLPFTDHKQAICKNGHMWLRCVLSYQACQTLTFRRCLLLDSIARLPKPEDPEWIKKILQAPCTLCDSPMI
ncbi:general transcription factor 3C polypeptide 4 [Lates japonicus]|uniref:General transcription factor 3C polypeptide 4 n=1 Tax=Lates japonicus TaxID=270547 RepID=A0AAD3N7I7_LATJO|nr:general transcription factor 3C polypeptide 4 [Lates japonicus]